ncbi:MAG: restriction endonuclease subunit M [Bacteroidales bacterium]|jgi:type I restriction enzyme M protein|nr:restriction endonuclease subunit M [Bacteroidales bacterium]
MDEIIKKGIEKKLVSFNDDLSRITYIYQNKSRNYLDPEEQVEAESFLKLVLVYNYPQNRIKLFEKVTMGASTKEADIIVYDDDMCLNPSIIVECKKQEVSEAEFAQAIEQAASYAYALSGTVKYIWTTSGIKDSYLQIDKERQTRIQIPNIPIYGKVVPKYNYVKGGRVKGEDAGNDEIKQQFFDLEQVSESELTNRFKKAHQSLWAGGELNPSDAFDELDKLIFCKIWDERKPRKKGEPYDFQIFDIGKPKNASQQDIDKVEQKITTDLAKRIFDLYDEGKQRDKEVFKDNIRLTPQRIRTVVSYLQGVNLSKTDLDSKGKAFETFMGTYFRGDFGQYFTPRNIVKFIVDVLPIKNDSKVLDTSCGSGGFLLYALDKVRQQAGDFYEEGSVEYYKHWHDFASNNLFGIEINEQIARTAKMNMIIHDDGHTNVIASDGLLRDEAIIAKTANTGFAYGTFDLIITNPPFGSVIKQTESAYLHQFCFGTKDVDWLDTKNTAVKKRDSQSTEVLFIEQDRNFLKEGGYLAIVIPDGILTNSTLQYVRNNISEWFRIVAVVSMPQKAFAAKGAGVKSSVLFLKKWTDEQSEKIRDSRQNLKEKIKSEADYKATIEKWEAEKKKILKNHTGFENTIGKTDKKEIEKTEAFKIWKQQIADKYNQKVSELKEQLEERLAELQKEIIDYPIFMAIADEIGYDATGKETAVNDLGVIGAELKKFIETL